jgi:hypothetical protein
MKKLENSKSNMKKVKLFIFSVISFIIVFFTIGLIPFAIESIYYPLKYDSKEVEFTILDKYQETSTLKSSRRHSVSIDSYYVSDFNQEVKVSEGEYYNNSSHITVYKYGDSLHHNQYNPMNGLIILVLFLIALYFILDKTLNCRLTLFGKKNVPRLILILVLLLQTFYLCYISNPLEIF